MKNNKKTDLLIGGRLYALMILDRHQIQAVHYDRIWINLFHEFHKKRGRKVRKKMRLAL